MIGKSYVGKKLEVKIYKFGGANEPNSVLEVFQFPFLSF